MSLSGLQSTLVSLAGSNGKRLRVAEEYTIATNNWNKLPELNKERTSPGSIVLKSFLCYCFCGFDGKLQMNEIERMNIKQEGEWRALSP